MESKDKDYKDPSKLVDLIFDKTEFIKSNNLSGSEVASLTRVLVKLFRYMNLRSKTTSPNYESIEDNLIDIIGETVLLYRNYINQQLK